MTWKDDAREKNRKKIIKGGNTADMDFGFL